MELNKVKNEIDSSVDTLAGRITWLVELVERQELELAAARRPVEMSFASVIQNHIATTTTIDPVTASTVSVDIVKLFNLSRDVENLPVTEASAGAGEPDAHNYSRDEMLEQEPEASASEQLKELATYCNKFRKTAKGIGLGWVVGRLRAIAAQVQALESCAQRPAPAVAGDAQRTDISARLREYASNPGYSHNDYADTMHAAAYEIERYYGGMLAWKQTAETKDKKLSDEIQARVTERIATGMRKSVPVAMVTRDKDGVDGVNWMVDSTAGDVAPGDILYKVRPTDDALWDQTMKDRDAYHDWADKLADAIASYFGVDIGEHSNMNLPWAEALDAINESLALLHGEVPESTAPAAPKKIEVIMRLTGYQLAALLDYTWPDRAKDMEQGETEISFWRREEATVIDGDECPAGLYFFYDDLPDEGSIHVDSAIPSAAPAPVHPTAAIPESSGYRFPIGENGEYEIIRADDGRKVGEVLFYVDALNIQRALAAAPAQPAPVDAKPHRTVAEIYADLATGVGLGRMDRLLKERADAQPAAQQGDGDIPTGDQVRAIARSASSSASDGASPQELVIAGWRAALAQRAGSKAKTACIQIPVPPASAAPGQSAGNWAIDQPALLSDRQCQGMKTLSAMHADQWAESHPGSPTAEQVDAVFVRDLLRRATTIASSMHSRPGGWAIDVPANTSILDTFKTKVDSLISTAEAFGVVVRIHTRPLLPLAMGNYEMVASVQERRAPGVPYDRLGKSVATEPVCDSCNGTGVFGILGHLCPFCSTPIAPQIVAAQEGGAA